MTKAAIYCRISQDRTGEEQGVTRQLEDCQALATQLGWTVVETYIDNDLSATTGKPRPEYARMLEAIKAGELDAVIAWHTDRLYRKLADLESLVTAVEQHGVTLRTCRAGEFDLGTATGRMLARIMASVSAGEGELKSERWRRSVRQRREQGLVHNFGPRLFGYERDGTVVQTEADIIRWLAAALIEGESVRALVRQLNAMDVPTTLGNPWSTQGLKRLIQNQRLTGASMLNGAVVGVGQWEPILDLETFEQVQTVFTVRRETGPRPPRVSLLLGVIQCGLCEQPLKSARLANKRRIYRCPPPPTGQGCGKIAIDAASTEDYVEGYAQKRLADPKVRARIQMMAATSGEAIAEVVNLEKRLHELETQLDEPGVPVETIMRAMQRTQERIDEYRAQAPGPAPALPRVGSWPTDLGRRSRLIKLAVKVVVVDPAAAPGRNKIDTDRIRIDPA